MVKTDVVARKIAAATKRLDEATTLIDRPLTDFLADTRDRDVATFYLFLAIQEAIDLAAHWLSDAGWGPADDAASSFDLLADKQVIPRDLAERMRGAVGLRNLIAHNYPLLDHARLHRDFREGTKTLDRFLAAVADAAGL